MGGVIGPVINRGDVWWADVPGDNVSPVLVLTRQRFTSRVTSLLVARVTTTVRNIPTEVVLDADDGLPRTCAANFDNVFTLQRRRFTNRISRLSDDRLREVCRAYRFAAGC
jgi:mRNA interferase MazF